MTPFPIADDHSIRGLVNFRDQPGDGWQEYVGVIGLPAGYADKYINSASMQAMMIAEVCLSFGEAGNDPVTLDTVPHDSLLMLHPRDVNRLTDWLRNSTTGKIQTVSAPEGEADHIPGMTYLLTFSDGREVRIYKTQQVHKGTVALWRLDSPPEITHPTYEVDRLPSLGKVNVTVRMHVGGPRITYHMWRLV